jgi:hypothetical protein
MFEQVDLVEPEILDGPRQIQHGVVPPSVGSEREFDGETHEGSPVRNASERRERWRIHHIVPR